MVYYYCWFHWQDPISNSPFVIYSKQGYLPLGKFFTVAVGKVWYGKLACHTKKKEIVECIFKWSIKSEAS
jgi:hypothetical protein